MRKEHIEYLREILKMGSITAAANNLNITPQALSASVKTLENEIGMQILDRSSQGVIYTPEGIRFLNTAIAFFEEIEEIKKIKGEEQLTVQLNIIKGFSSHFAIDLIKGINVANDNVKLDLNIQDVEILGQQLQNKEINHFMVAKPKYNGRFFPDETDNNLNDNHSIENGEISRLCCLVPKAMPIYNLKSISVKTASKYPVSFLKTNYEDSASIRYVLNEITNFDNEVIIDNIIEHKMNILLGKRIGFDFINEISEWNSYDSMIKIIPLKENITLNLCIATRKGEKDELLEAILKNAIFN